MKRRLFILLTLVGSLLLPWNMAAQGGAQASGTALAPGLPFPICFESIFMIGVISAAVPVRKISSDMINSLLVTSRSIISISKSFAILIIASRVIPSKADDASEGVIN